MEVKNIGMMNSSSIDNLNIQPFTPFGFNLRNNLPSGTNSPNLLSVLRPGGESTASIATSLTQGIEKMKLKHFQGLFDVYKKKFKSNTGLDIVRGMLDFLIEELGCSKATFVPID